MSDVISSNMVHSKLAPLGWESMLVLSGMPFPLTSMAWIEVRVGSWYADATNTYRFPLSIEGQTVYYEISLSCGFFRSYCDAISMLVKRKSGAFTIQEQETMQVSILANNLTVDAYPIDDRGIIDSRNPESVYQGTGVEAGEEWISVNYSFTGKEKRIIVVKDIIGSFTLNMPEDERWNDLSEEKAYVKDIITTPLSFSLFEQQIGSKGNQINATEPFILGYNNPTWFSGKLTKLTNNLLYLLGHNLFNGITKTRLNNATMTLASNNPAYVWDVPLNILSGAKVIYTMTITGDPNIDIPIASFQSIVRQGGSTKAERDAVDAAHVLALADLASRYEDGLYDDDQAGYNAALAALLSNYAAQLAQLETQRPSYLSCVVPNSLKYADDISSRIDGLIIIKKGYELSDGSRTLEEITRANFDYLTFSRGAHNDSAIITGYKIKTYTSPKTRTVSGVSFISLEASGHRRIRAAVDLFLKPNDVCVYGTGESEYFTVGQITYSVNERSATMEVTEADEIL